MGARSLRNRPRAPRRAFARLLGPLVLLFAGLSVATTAKAGPNELLVQAVTSPLDSGLMVLRYTFGGDGFFYSKDGGKTFALGCRSSLKPEGSVPRSLGPMAIDGDDRMVVGIFGAALIDDGKGCGWSRSPELEGKWVRDVTPLPTDPRITYAISSNGDEDALNGVYRREPGGEWEPVGMQLPMLMSRLRIAPLPDGKLRFYISGSDGQIPDEDSDAGLPVANFVMLVSDDEGETYTKHVYGDANGDFTLEAIDPTNPDRIVVSVLRLRDETNKAIPDLLLVSDDRGESFTEWTTVTEIGGLVFGEDGELWLGDAGDTMSPDAPQGLLYAPSLDEAPTQLSDEYPVRCLLLTGDELYACQRWSFGTVDRETGEFAATLKFTELDQILSCDGESTAIACRAQLCSAYCGTAHFPQAPMCVDEYRSTIDRGCAPSSTGTAGSAGAAGSAGSAGTAGGDSSTRDGGSNSDVDSDDASAEESPSEPKQKSSGGCAAVALPSDASSCISLLLSVIAGVLIARRRSRRRA